MRRAVWESTDCLDLYERAGAETTQAAHRRTVDMFFTTNERLVATDTDDTVDVYDAAVLVAGGPDLRERLRPEQAGSSGSRRSA
jgi:hypothetical protein